MGTISVSLPTDGTAADVADYNTPITTIVNAINGGLDNDNLAAAAAIAGTKIADNAITTGKIANGSVTPDKLDLDPLSNIVATSQTTTSTSFADLTTSGPLVTVTIGANGAALVSIRAMCGDTVQHAKCWLGIDVSGASTVAANETDAAGYTAYAANAQQVAVGTFLITGLTPGSTAFKLQYKVTTGGGGSGTGTFSDRKLSVVPL